MSTLAIMASMLGCGTGGGHDSAGLDGSSATPPSGDDTGNGGDDVGQFTSPDGSAVYGDSCASTNAAPTRVRPTVWIVLDASGLEQVDAGGTTSFTYDSALWTSARNALVGTGALVSSLQSLEEIGFVGSSTGEPMTHTALDGGFSQVGCPELLVVPPGIMNYAAIEQGFPAMPPNDGSEPSTYHGLRYAIDHSPAGGSNAIVLVYGGFDEWLCGDESELPSNLVMPSRGLHQYSLNEAIDAQQAMILAAMDGAAKGIKIFDINPGNVDANAASTHAQIAQIGNTGFGTFNTQTAGDLQAALQQVLTTVVSCDVSLNGTVVAGAECQGIVDIAGTPVACDDPNGWKLKDPSTIEFVGAACSNLEAHPDDLVHAIFPCQAFNVTR
jgi:hypothetical protein